MGAGILEFVEIKKVGNGLDTLVKGLLDSKTAIVTPESLDSLIEESLDQLERERFCQLSRRWTN